jgi:SAM-dependent methyltransferase
MTRAEAITMIDNFWSKDEIPVFHTGLPACRYSEYIFILMNLPLIPSTILDAGSGASLLPSFLSSLGHTVTATDIWDKENKSIEGSLERALQIREKRGFPYEICQTDLQSLPFPDKSFDITVCNSTIEHISEEDNRDIRVVKELLRVSNDLVFFTFPVKTAPKQRLQPDNEGEHPSSRMYSFNTAIQRLVLPAIDSGFFIVPAEGMVDNGKLLLKRRL